MTDPIPGQASRSTPPSPSRGTTRRRSDVEREAAVAEDTSLTDQTAPTSRFRPRTRAAWATVVIAGTFAALWIVFAVRAVDRNNHPWPTITPPPATALPDLNATVAATNRLLFPDRPSASPAASPVASPVASPAASPAATLLATPRP